MYTPPTHSATLMEGKKGMPPSDTLTPESVTAPEASQRGGETQRGRKSTPSEGLESWLLVTCFSVFSELLGAASLCSTDNSKRSSSIFLINSSMIFRP